VPDGGVTDDDDPRITLTLDRVLEPGETLTLLRNGSVARTMSSGSTLSYSEDDLDDGLYTYSAQLTDASGNVTTLDLNGALPGTDFTFRVD
jgi:hypothetical protein